METWSGSRERSVQLAEVEEWIREASRRFNRAPVVVDPWAIGSGQRLRAGGIKVIEFSFSSASVGRLASTLHPLIPRPAAVLGRPHWILVPARTRELAGVGGRVVDVLAQLSITRPGTTSASTGDGL